MQFNGAVNRRLRPAAILKGRTAEHIQWLWDAVLYFGRAGDDLIPCPFALSFSAVLPGGDSILVPT